MAKLYQRPQRPEVDEALAHVKELFDAAPWLPEYHPHAGHSAISGALHVTYRDIQVLYQETLELRAEVGRMAALMVPGIGHEQNMDDAK